MAAASGASEGMPRRGRTTRPAALGTPAFVVCLALVVLAQVVLAQLAYIGGSLVHVPVGFDTAYNLTVPRNLALVGEYASDGYLQGFRFVPFDVRISTGAVVLAPLALAFTAFTEPVFAARLCMVGWYVLLLAALAVFGLRVGGRWLAIVLPIAPLTVNLFGAFGWAELQGPVDVLGEIPAAAMLVFAVILLRWRSRWALAASALVLGVAIGTKTVAAVALPAMLLAVILIDRRLARRRRIGRLVLFTTLALAPSALWQVVLLLTLRRTAYLENLAAQLDFLSYGGSGLRADAELGMNFAAFFESWNAPAPVVVAVTLAVLGFGGVLGVRAVRTLVRRGRRSGPGGVSRVEAAQLVAFTLIALAWVGWWMLIASGPFSRSVYPGQVLLAAAVCILLFRGIPVLAPGTVRGRFALRTVAVAGGVVLAAAALPTVERVVSPSGLTLSQQRVIATGLEDGTGRYWFDPGSIIPAAGVGWTADIRPHPHERGTPLPGRLMIGMSAAVMDSLEPDQRAAFDDCGAIVLEVYGATVCAPE